MSAAALGASIVAPPIPARIDTPSVVVDLDRFEANVERMATFLAERSVGLRPHAKTHSSTAVAKYQLEHGALGCTVGTLRMAAAMADAGIDDLFVAAPVWPDSEETRRLRDLHDRVRLTVGIDSAEAAQRIAAAIAGGSSRLRVLVEIDSGERRSGVTPAQAQAVAVAASKAGLQVAGVFTHGGHSYRGPGKAAEAAVDEVELLGEAARLLEDVGIEVETVSAGSTPTAHLSARAPVNEERPGTYVFGDRQQVYLGGCAGDEVALAVAATVTSTAVPGQVILNSGAKALSKDKPGWLGDFGTVPAYPDGVITRLFDFHAVLEFPEGAARPKLGEVVAVIPNHVCPVVNLSRGLVTARNGVINGFWAIDARG
jgi:D-serine deaminase-like pyridoxal phosphate-dependent protein